MQASQNSLISTWRAAASAPSVGIFGLAECVAAIVFTRAAFPRFIKLIVLNGGGGVDSAELLAAWRQQSSCAPDQTTDLIGRLAT